MQSIAGLLYFSLVINKCLSTVELKRDETQNAKRAIVWTNSGQSPIVLRRLAFSIAKASHAAHGHGIAYVLVYENLNVSCLDDQGRIKWPWPSVMNGGLNLITSAVRCATLNLTGLSKPIQEARLEEKFPCRASAPRMLSNTFYLLPMDQIRVNEEALSEISEAIIKHGHSRTDLVDYGRGNNFRFVLDKIMILLGVEKMIYLDSDAIMENDPTPLYEENNEMPLVVARSSHNSYGLATARNEFGETDLRRTRKWGFIHPKKQCFNAGVMMVNIVQYCQSDILSKMVEVARSHIESPLFRQSGNQPIIEVAAAQHTHYVSYIWNCRHERDPDLRCNIVHSKRDLNISKTLWRMMISFLDSENKLDAGWKNYRFDDADEDAFKDLKSIMKRGHKHKKDNLNILTA